MSDVLVRFALDDEQTEWVTFAIPEEQARAEGLELATRRGGDVKEAHQTFADATAQVVPVAESILGRLKDMADIPREIEVEFGLALSVKAGMVIASSEATANFRVKLTWARNTE